MGGNVPDDDLLHTSGRVVRQKCARFAYKTTFETRVNAVT